MLFSQIAPHINGFFKNTGSEESVKLPSTRSNTKG